MPCTSEGYSDPTQHEKNISRAAAVIEEVKGGPPVSREAWRGYHPRVANRFVPKEEADAIVAEACALMSGLPSHSSVLALSLEAQMWWRDHQKKDSERAARQLREAQRKKKQEAALAKLTPGERRLLGLK